MIDLINKLHSLNFLGAIVHTMPYCLKKELGDCESVLDLGCGPSSPVQYCKNIKYSVGVEIFKPYLETAMKNKTHSEFIEKNILDLDFKDKSFDAVVLTEVIEHLSESDAKKIIKMAEKWARKKLIITSPNGFLKQNIMDNNEYQRHLSGWNYGKMKKMGFEVNGLAGLKQIRQEVDSETMGDDLLSSIKFNPKFFWFVISTLSQIFTYYFPKNSFELFSVKEIK